VEALGDFESLRRYPDFTSTVECLANPGRNERNGFVAIVPNSRMLDKTAQGSSYIQFLEQVVSLTYEHGFQAVLVVHDEHQDRKIAESIQASAGRDLPIIEHPDPRFLKAVLASAAFVVGSRFHALISALSCGVPCVGVGWSHKYEELFSEYGVSDCLLENFGNKQEVERVLVQVMDTTRRQELVRNIVSATSRQQQETEKMWAEVVEAIERATGKMSFRAGA
jgi:colanic acid/amylovoran biosynthesis protein